MAELRNDVILAPTFGNDTYEKNPQTGRYEKVNSSGNALKAGISNEPYQWHIGDYYFDCWMQCSQSTTITITSHPVSVGANVADHAFSEPKEFTFQLSVLNTIANKIFSGADSRAVNAYNLLTELQAKRQFVELGTKYGTYQNILIKNITVDDTFETQEHMTATITLQEVITANSSTFQVSANRHATDSTNRGNVSTIPPLGTEERRIYDKIKIENDMKQLGQLAA